MLLFKYVALDKDSLKMKPFKQKISTVVVGAVLLALTGAGFARQIAFAASTTLYISPSSASVQSGQTFGVQVRVNPGTNVDTVHVILSYNSSVLKYISYSNAGSPFSYQPPGFSASGGKVAFDQADTSGSVTTDSFVATINFEALTGSGSTSLSLSGSDVAYAGSSVSPGVAGATIALTTPPPPPSGGGGSTPPPSSGGGSSTPPSSGSHTSPSSTKQPTTTPPPSQTSTPITAAPKDVEYTRATIHVTGKDATKVYIQFGLNGQLSVSTKVSDFAATHDIAIDPSMLVPGQTYTYVVVSTNQQGVTTKSAPETFTTKGLTIYVNVYDKNHRPLAGKKVTLHSLPQTATTNNDGQAEFTGVAPGTHHVLYSDGGKQYDQPVLVADNIKTVDGQQTADVQHFSVVYSFTQASVWERSLPWVIGAIVVLILAVLGGWFIRRRTYVSSLNKAAATVDGGSVVVGGTQPIELEQPQVPIQAVQTQGPLAVTPIAEPLPENHGDTVGAHPASSGNPVITPTVSTDSPVTPQPDQFVHPTVPVTPPAGNDSEAVHRV